MKPCVDSAQRAVLAGLADRLIPAGGGLPSASAAGVAGDGADSVLAARPDLEAPLARVLAWVGDRDPDLAIRALETEDPAGFAALAELVAGAYFLDPGVREALGYEGQRPRPIDPEPDYEDLLPAAIERGPIYRPTPGRTSRRAQERGGGTAGRGAS